MFTPRRMLTTVALLILPALGWLEPARGFQAGGFEQKLVAAGISSPTAMEFAPDGRLFVAEKSGRLRVIKNGVLLESDFLTMSVNSDSERGLLGIAFDPDFDANRFVYIYYTRATFPIKNRVSRFAADPSNPDVALPVEDILLDDIASDGGNHNGGAIHFGIDGMLYVATGDAGAIPSNSQNLTNLSGKILRIAPDGSIPLDNPFVDIPEARGEIWALGLRNPYTFAVDPVTGTIHINDVGQATWEEVNLGAKGANYGWPECEGVCGEPGFTDPIHAYDHGLGRAITGGTFYRGTQFASYYVGSYFFSDYLGGWIKWLDQNNRVWDFWNPQNGPVDLKVGPEGSLYYLSIFDSAVYKIQRTTSPSQPPTASIIATHPPGQSPRSVSFNGGASVDPDGDVLTYSWNFGDGSRTVGGAVVSHTYRKKGTYTAVLTVTDGRGGQATASRRIHVKK